MNHAVDYDLFLYADDTRLVYQHKDVGENNQNLNNNIFWVSVTGFFIISWVFNLEKTRQKAYYLPQKLKLSKVGSFGNRYGKTHIKQCHTVSYLGCSLVKNLSGESMALKVINKAK